MSHKCFKPGCQFQLPDTYLLPHCPWHAAPGNGIVKIVSAAGILVAGVGAGLAYNKIRDAIKRRKIRARQKEWRRSAGQEPAPSEDNSWENTSNVAPKRTREW